MKRKTERAVAGFLRIALVAVVVLLQILLIMLLVYYLRGNAIWLYFIIEVASVLEIILLVSRNHNSSYTIAWVLVIALLPVFGHVLYLLWGHSDVKGMRPNRIRASIENGNGYLDKDPAIYAKLGKEYPSRKRMAGYLGRKDFPLYQNTACQYFPLGENQFEALLAELEKAEHYIFISTFILSPGKLWDCMKDILIRKAQQGVEVRIMWDDFGSILTAPDNLIRELGSYGIQARRFAPVHMFISRMYINYRNHQKITVIDGKIAYTGGTNIADEYINAYEKHGHWKDTAIRIEGDAVWSLTVTFLQMWDAEAGAASNYSKYRADTAIRSGSYIQPFADGPVNNPDNPAEVMYRSMISNAKEYVWITTPYLVIDNNMIEALCTAAASGVDVRIITPGIWDHWYVRTVSRSNYKELLKAGVRIFEYTPGFMHAKTILADDDIAIAGSINMDYRSFYLHFENGVWICGDKVLSEIKKDIADTLTFCEEVELESYLERPWYTRLFSGFLRIFAVVM